MRSGMAERKRALGIRTVVNSDGSEPVREDPRLRGIPGSTHCQGMLVTLHRAPLLHLLPWLTPPTFVYVLSSLSDVTTRSFSSPSSHSLVLTASSSLSRITPASFSPPSGSSATSLAPSPHLPPALLPRLPPLHELPSRLFSFPLGAFWTDPPSRLHREV